jgi:hypothetical protein
MGRECGMSDVKKGAAEHLAPMVDECYSLADSRFDRLNGWTYLAKLLHEARHCLDLSEKYNSLESLDKMEQVLLAQSLFRNAIISYCKCFASAAPGRITLDRNTVFKGHDVLKGKHERMVVIRNTFAAHNGENDLDTATLAVKETGNAFLIRHTYTLTTPLNEYGDYREVLEHCGNYVVIAINRYLDRLEKDLGKRIRIS